MKIIVWFRRDLRLADNPALCAAAAADEVLPVYVLDEAGPDSGERPIGGASRWWLGNALAAFKSTVPNLTLLRGDAQEEVLKLAKSAGAGAVYWNRCYEPGTIARDRRVKQALSDAGIGARSFQGNLLIEPWRITTRSGGPFKVYSPFWRALRQQEMAAPLKAPQLDWTRTSTGLSLHDLALLPTSPNWARHWNGFWTPGEQGAAKRLEGFVGTALPDYARGRDLPGRELTSRLSPHLHFGEISARQVWARINFAAAIDAGLAQAAEKFLSELAWREFSAHLLYHFPKLPTANWRAEFDAYPWQDDPGALIAWQQGKTGYPMVDAGMRELRQTGYMHNRVRMITASFLVKHLRIDWRQGEAWFWDNLADADLANNAAGWQWVAGSGADASPYFRIFNPMIQGRKFDPDGAYVRRWCPELKALPDEHIHAPFEAPAEVLNKAGVELGNTWPLPIVDHKQARNTALAGYDRVKAARA